MATTEKPIALQSELDKAASSFEGFLAPEEENVEPEEVEVEEAESEEEVEEVEELVDDFDDEDEEEVEQEDIEEEVEQPQLYTVKVDGVETEVTLEELQNGYSRQQDYTRKTQELSQQRKTIEQQQAELTQRDAIYSQLLPKMEAQLNAELGDEPDWQKLYEDDPVGYVREKQLWDQKKEKLSAVQVEQQRLQQEALAEQQKQIQAMVEEGNKKLLEIIPEWSKPETAAQEKAAIRQYAIDVLGYSPQEMDQVYDYRALIGLRSAWLQHEAGQATKKKPTQKAAARVGKPGSTTRKRSAAPEKKLRQRLKQTGKQQDAAKLFEQLLK
jgi:hypothetical protein